jgi:hypothetical protein
VRWQIPSCATVISLHNGTGCPTASNDIREEGV